jgi:hypothetical protein
VETTDQGFRVEALGSLRAMPKNAKLRLEHVSSTDILVAEGDACLTENDEEVCRRYARILPLRTNRFFSESVSDKSRACLGAAWFPLAREQIFELPNGLRRKFELTSTLTFNADNISVQEQVQVSDSDPQQPNVAPRLYRRAQDVRTLALAPNALVGNKASLWSRMMEQQVHIGAKVIPEKPVFPMPAKPAPEKEEATAEAPKEPKAAEPAKAPAEAAKPPAAATGKAATPAPKTPPANKATAKPSGP